MEQIKNIVSEKPELLGLVFMAAGALILIGAICRWEWVVGRDATGNRIRTGLFGWIVYKLFGRRAFFIFTGAVILLAGIAWFVFMSML